MTISPHPTLTTHHDFLRAGVNGIYGLITAIIILNNILPPNLDGNTPLSYSLYTGYAHLAGGLCCGLCGLASGVCIGIAGESGVRAFTQLDWMTKQVRAREFGGGGENTDTHTRRHTNDPPLTVYTTLHHTPDLSVPCTAYRGPGGLRKEERIRSSSAQSSSR
jgi:ATP synthase proteolipid subunit